MSNARGTRKLAATEDLARITKRVIVGVSGGKDSVAVLELLHRHGIRVSGYFCYIVRGLSFQQRYIDYLRRRYDMEIVEWPHPDLGLYYRSGRYCAQTPDMPQLTFRELVDGARARFGVHWLATGEKKLDSLQRRGMLSAWGAIQVGRQRAFPLSEWNGRDVFAYLKHTGVQLAPDYGMFGHSLRSPTESFDLTAIKAAYPEDYERICHAFPFAEASTRRVERLVADA